MRNAIAIVGIACCYPDARSPVELWENVLSQRRSFRRIPSERLNLDDYFSDDRTIPDAVYATQAAVIEGFEFDRVKFKVAGKTFRSSDWVHWLALDIAEKALDDANLLTSDDLPKDTTGVFLGNTLTGEFSRANTLRLRYPYVRRIAEDVLNRSDVSKEQIPNILKDLEKTFKKNFPEITEESLAGGLSNTIAGRICNYFDLKGGGYTVDGACSSSLLAVANACSTLLAGDVDAALAGGVDLSIDPFELIGFAKTGALADGQMRVYDKRSNGFIPGEGCGFVLLMREEDAIKSGRKIYAVIKGWGISSDGKGGITRPEVAGQKLALKRAYRRAGFGIESVAYFEGHGTGTAVGDTTELKTLSEARREASASTQAGVISSVKALIGHTKAAAGIAGLIKATMALDSEILPPTTGCEKPHAELDCENPALKVLLSGEIWDPQTPLRAGVSSMGFGGINAHIVLEKESLKSRSKLSHREKTLISSGQDAEIFLLSDDTLKGLEDRIGQLLRFSARLSNAELGDLSNYLAQTLSYKKFRAAIIAETPAELEKRLKLLSQKIKQSGELIFDKENKIFFGSTKSEPRIGFLFSGQGSPSNLDGGLWRRRFESVREIYALNQLPSGIDAIQTEIAQPAIVKASVAGLQILDRFDITAKAGIGHSLGELTALHWAGAYDAASLMKIAEKRGLAMSETSKTKGAMLSISTDLQQVETFLQTTEKIVIAGFNTPHQIVVSGEEKEIEHLQKTLKTQNIASVKLPVSHAFHSPLVARSAKVLAEHLAEVDFQHLNEAVYSTITGEKLKPDEDLRELLKRQIVSPVRFVEAVERAERSGIDLWIEVGTGNILSGLVENITQTPSTAIEAGSESLSGLWQTVGASFAFGHRINQPEIFSGRFTRPFDLDWQPKFFANPCESAPLPDNQHSEYVDPEILSEDSEIDDFEEVSEYLNEELSPLELVTKLVAERAELPYSAITPDSRMLSDLHLNSITVGQIVTTVAKKLGASQPLSPTEFADSKITEIATALEKYKNIKDSGNQFEAENLPVGLDSWVRPFQIELVEKPLVKNVAEPENGIWEIFALEDSEFAGKINQQKHKLSGKGVICCVPENAHSSEISLLLESAQAIRKTDKGKFIMVQNGRSCAGFARSFALENPGITTSIINLPFANEAAVDCLFEEISATQNFAEVHYRPDGSRLETIVRPLELTADKTDIPLTENDVLLVTGGAKGITAECVLALAQETGVRLALLGTSDAVTNREVSANLERFLSSKINFKYYAVDITDEDAVNSTVKKIKDELGEIRGIFHAAAKNEPILIQDLNKETFQQTLDVKIKGMENLLSVIPAEQLKLFITFGSIIARTGLPGESAYGLANEWLTQLTKDFQAKNPNCKCLAYEWSVWSGVGMANRVADLDLLIRQGISPISPARGVETFLDLLRQKDMPTSFVVMSRFQDVPTFKVERPELPLWRFLEEPRIYYPEVELIVDVELSNSNDLYLEDHKIAGERVLPAVMGMEALAEVAMALLGKNERPAFHDLSFSRPVVVDENEPLKIRILALADQNGRVEVALRSAETNLQINHFQGICEFGKTPEKMSFDKDFQLNGHADTRIELDPQKDLYGKILFHQGRFQRLANYKHLEARECVAEIVNGNKKDWFSRYLPEKLLLGDPAMRDTAIHAIQACIPQATLLPIGVDEIVVGPNGDSESNIVFAKERSQAGDIFTYDLQITDQEGHLAEVWKGLRLQMIQGSEFKDKLAEPLLAVYLERKIGELFKTSDISLTLQNDATLERRERSEKAFRQILGQTAKIYYRPDGKPETDNGLHISASHCQDLTLAVANRARIGCDIEAVEQRDPDGWRNLLGPDGFELAEKIATTTREDIHSSATRVWSIRECLKKAGADRDLLTTLSLIVKDDWILLKSDSYRIVSYKPRTKTGDDQFIYTVLSSNKK